MVVQRADQTAPLDNRVALALRLDTETTERMAVDVASNFWLQDGWQTICASAGANSNSMARDPS